MFSINRRILEQECSNIQSFRRKTGFLASELDELIGSISSSEILESSVDKIRKSSEELKDRLRVIDSYTAGIERVLKVTERCERSVEGEVEKVIIRYKHQAVRKLDLNQSLKLENSLKDIFE